MLTAEDFRISSIKDNFSICSPQVGKYAAKAANHCLNEYQCGQGTGLLSPNRLEHGILYELWFKTPHATCFLTSPYHLSYNSSLNISLGPSWQSPTASLAQSSNINAYNRYLLRISGKGYLVIHTHYTVAVDKFGWDGKTYSYLTQ